MRCLCSLKRCVLTLIRVSLVACQRAVSDVATCFVLNVHAPKCIVLGVCVCRVLTLWHNALLAVRECVPKKR